MAAPKIGTVVDGYVFVGGNPNQKTSWASVEAAKEVPIPSPSFTASIGRGMMDVGQGIKQFALGITNPERAKEYTQEVQDEIGTYERGVDGFDAGRLVGNIAATLPAGLVGGGAGAGAQIARAGLSGILGSGAQFVPEGGSRMENAAVGGILGAGMQAIPSAYGAIRRMAAPNRTMAAAAQEAADIGVRPTPAQTTGSRTLQKVEMGLENTAGGSMAMEQLQRSNSTAINRAIAKKLGVNSDSLDREVLGQARTKASRWYDAALKNESLSPDQQFVDELDNIVSQFNAPGAELPQGIVGRINSLKGMSGVSGEQYQAARSAIGADAVAAFRSGDTNKARALDALQEAYDDLAARSLPAHKLEFFDKARNQTRILKTLEKAVDPQSGNVSTQKLVTALRQKDPGFFFYGKGDNPLADVMTAGSFLKQGPDSGTATRLGAMFTPSILGAGYGGYEGGWEGAAKGAVIGTAAPYLLTRGYLGATAPQGILGPAVQRGANYLYPALGSIMAQP